SYADKQKKNNKQTNKTTTTYAPPYVVVEKKNFPSPKEDSVTDLGQTYQRVSIYLHAGTKLFPERTRLLTSDSRGALFLLFGSQIALSS
ncbi:MAG: hypothetical protein ACK53Y_21655, partial [bacterium]